MTTWASCDVCLFCIFKFVTVVDACVFANSSPTWNGVVHLLYADQGIPMIPPDQPCQDLLREWEFEVWHEHKGRFTPDHQEALPTNNYIWVDRYRWDGDQDQTGTWSETETALAHVKRCRTEYGYKWYQVHDVPAFSSDDYELP